MTTTTIPEQDRSLTTDQRLELHRFLVEMADRVSVRRGNANAFYASGQTLLVGLFASFGDRAPEATHAAVALAGIVLSGVWFLHLRSYRDLNRAKFEVICDLERSLSVKPFTDEDRHLGKDRLKWWKRRYAELGTVERIVPFIFAALHVAIASASA